MRYIAVGKLKDSEEYGVWICDGFDKKELVSRHTSAEFIRHGGKSMANHLDVQLLDLIPQPEAEAKLQQIQDELDHYKEIQSEVYEINRKALLRAGVDTSQFVLSSQAVEEGKTYTSEGIDLLAKRAQQESLAKLKGACARVMGFPVDSDHGYADLNATAWAVGWEYMNDTMRPGGVKILPWMRAAADAIGNYIGTRTPDSGLQQIVTVYWKSFYDGVDDLLKLPKELQRVIDLARDVCESNAPTTQLIRQLREAGKAWQAVYPQRFR